MITAPASGSGKTLMTCGILQALLDRGITAASFKCGPDYIDPLFHRTVLGTPSGNLDTFFTGEEMTRALFMKRAAGADVSVIEGAMGYYDGLGGISSACSAYDIARVTGTPAVLVVGCRGMGLSVVPYIKGFLEYREDSRIAGVILNRLASSLYEALSRKIREELHIQVFGYLPDDEGLQFESRHLGLVLPEEVEGIRERLRDAAVLMEKTVDIDGLLALADTAEEMECAVNDAEKAAGAVQNAESTVIAAGAAQSVESADIAEGITYGAEGRPPVIAVSRDEAFCFLYEENLDLLRAYGADLRFFSPVHDMELPDADGLLLCGGYPELHLESVSRNEGMRRSVREAVRTRHMPCLAECGGFMYLLEEMEDMDGRSYPVAGVLPGRAFRTRKLCRFGYVTLHPLSPGMIGGDTGPVKGHEFHYYDTDMNGQAFRAVKPLTGKSWECMNLTENLAAGFPHLYYPSNPKVAERFVAACAAFGRSRCQKLS